MLFLIICKVFMAAIRIGVYYVKLNVYVSLLISVRNPVGEELCPAKFCASLKTKLLMPTTVILV
jgi:hypothetical protein